MQLNYKSDYQTLAVKNIEKIYISEIKKATIRRLSPHNKLLFNN